MGPAGALPGSCPPLSYYGQCFYPHYSHLAICALTELVRNLPVSPQHGPLGAHSQLGAGSATGPFTLLRLATLSDLLGH